MRLSYCYLFLFCLSLLQASSREHISPEMGLFTDQSSSESLWLDATGARAFVLGEDGVRSTINLPDAARSAVALPDGRLLMAGYLSGRLMELDASLEHVSLHELTTDYPVGLALVDGNLVVAGYGRGEVVLVDPETFLPTARIEVVQQPWWVAGSPAGRWAAVGHLVPETASNTEESAASVSLIDVAAGRLAAHIRLPYGSSNVRQMQFSPDGRWLYVLHTLGRVAVPTTQFDRGWVNTNAMTVIDVTAQKHEATLLLDQVTHGAADPWGMALSEDGSVAWITLAGAHELARVDLEGLHQHLAGEVPEASYSQFSGSSAWIWSQIKDDPSRKADLAHHLSALYGAGLMRRVALPVEGPRAVVASDGIVTVAGYFSGDWVRFDGDRLEVVARGAFGSQPEETLERKGERIFHDGRFAFQAWLSCVSCHPDARADGLNWDNLNDGLGNPKNAKSMLGVHATAPMMALGVREDMSLAVKKGFTLFQLYDAGPEVLEPVEAYLSSLEPLPSPWLVEGELSEAAIRGQKIFKGKAECIDCHGGSWKTNRGSHDVGTGTAVDGNREYDTPSLIELWRTAPYLHDGRAPTLESVFIEHNVDDMHGYVSDLTEAEFADLLTYLKSL